MAKTLAKFETSSVRLTLKRHNFSTDVDYVKLYSVVSEPKNKNAGWHGETSYYDHESQAAEYFQSEVHFWMR